MVLMTIGMTAARNTMTAFDWVPTPNHTTTIGTKAMIGEVLSATIRARTNSAAAAEREAGADRDAEPDGRAGSPGRIPAG